MSTPSLKITVVGPMHGGSLSIARFATRALVRLGHAVTFVDNSVFGGALAALRVFDGNRTESDGYHAVLTGVAQATSARNVERSQPDLVLYLAQAPVRSADLRRISDGPVTTVFWFVEDFRTFPYWSTVAGSVDHFWTLQEGEFEQALRTKGQRVVDWVPLACEPGVHHPYAPDATTAWASEVSFAGAGYPNRHRVLAALLDLGPRIFGTHWKDDAVLAPYVGNDGELSSVDLAHIFSATKVNLNIWSSVFHDGLAEKKDFVNPRTFEICACGGFQLADASAPVERFFEPGVELVTFGSIDEARDKARYFLRHDAERAAIAERGRLRAHAEHTYDQRLAGALGRVWERTEKLQRRVVDRGGRPHA